MRAAAQGILVAAMALAVAWLLAKMTRSDQADWLLIRLAIALGVVSLVFVAAFGVGNIRRRQR